VERTATVLHTFNAVELANTINGLSKLGVQPGEAFVEVGREGGREGSTEAMVGVHEQKRVLLTGAIPYTGIFGNGLGDPLDVPFPGETAFLSAPAPSPRFPLPSF
jgi:hypothetical protein